MKMKISFLLAAWALFIFLFIGAGQLDDRTSSASPVLSQSINPGIYPLTAQAPIYLGRNYYREPVRLGGGSPLISQEPSADWRSQWPYNTSLGPIQRARVFPYADPVGIEEYHVPAIVEFLQPDYQPPGFDYSYYVPALGKFASPSWTPPGANYSLHVPAVGAFLNRSWQYPGLDTRYYSPWMIEYLRS